MKWKGEGKDNDGNRHETRKNDEEKTWTISGTFAGKGKRATNSPKRQRQRETEESEKPRDDKKRERARGARRTTTKANVANESRRQRHGDDKVNDTRKHLSTTHKTNGCFVD